MRTIIQYTIIILMITALVVGINMFVNYIQERNIECENLGIEVHCGDFSIGCAKDCEKLGQEYFKYESGGFSSSSCICFLNKEVKQIW